MAPKSQGWIDERIYTYAVAHSTGPDPVLVDLAIETHALLGDRARMQITHEQGALLTMLTRLVGVTTAIEVGTFTGYSSICIARGLLPGGHLLCCDVSEDFTAVARRYWELAGLADRIELQLGPAVETLRRLPPHEHVDLAFIDADKANYESYYEAILERLRPGGLIVVDNTLWSGAVLDEPSADDIDTAAIQAFNDAIAADHRIDVVLLPFADGVTLIRKR